MKAYGSVLALAARQTVYKLLLILGLTGAAQTALFLTAPGRLQAELDAMGGVIRGGFDLESVIRESHVDLPAAAGFLALCAVLALLGWDGAGSRSRYTLRRLALSERKLTLLWAGYGALCFLIFWAFQALVMLLLCQWSAALGNPERADAMTVFLAFYRLDYLHSLLPLAEWTRLARNLVLLPALGTACACCAYHHRHGRRDFTILALAAATLLFFSSYGMGGTNGDLAMIFFAAALAAVQLYNLGRWRNEED